MKQHTGQDICPDKQAARHRFFHQQVDYLWVTLRRCRRSIRPRPLASPKSVSLHTVQFRRFTTAPEADLIRPTLVGTPSPVPNRWMQPSRPLPDYQTRPTVHPMRWGWKPLHSSLFSRLVTPSQPPTPHTGKMPLRLALASLRGVWSDATSGQSISHPHL